MEEFSPTFMGRSLDHENIFHKVSRINNQAGEGYLRFPNFWRAIQII